jgi:hypothetical protein
MDWTLKDWTLFLVTASTMLLGLALVWSNSRLERQKQHLLDVCEAGVSTFKRTCYCRGDVLGVCVSAVVVQIDQRARTVTYGPWARHMSCTICHAKWPQMIPEEEVKVG